MMRGVGFQKRLDKVVAVRCVAKKSGFLYLESTGFFSLHRNIYIFFPTVIRDGANYSGA